ncbi:MAG: peptide chain release factor N(5)-glutamine methyltransferase [Candidatus Latescibacterota bacterium]
MSARAWRLLDLLNETTRFLTGKGFGSARLEAELLLADVLRLRRLDLYLQFERVLTEPEVNAYREHVRRRLRREPVQQITGQAGFRELVLEVTPEVLIPRPETEVLAQAVLDLLEPDPGSPVLDLGCGSGAIALALAHERPGMRVIATDLSKPALGVARRNATRLGLADRVAFIQADLLSPWRAARPIFTSIVSNPPYVPTATIASLEPEVRDHEPHLALDGGPDGLAVLARIASAAGPLLRPKGILCLEVGDGQAEVVRGLLEATGAYAEIASRHDLNRVPRVVTARRAD